MSFLSNPYDLLEFELDLDIDFCGFYKDIDFDDLLFDFYLSFYLKPSCLFSLSKNLLPLLEFSPSYLLFILLNLFPSLSPYLELLFSLCL